MSRSPSLRGLLAGCCALGLASGAALAQDPPTTPEIPPAPELPTPATPTERDAAERRPLPWRVIGFEDPRETACDPLDARHGACVELVQFQDLSQVWGPSDRAPREVGPAMRATSAAAAAAWQTLAFRWFQEKQAPADVVVPDGILALPAAADTWDAASPARRRLVSLPDRDAWLDEAAWTGEAGLFRPLLWAAPEGVPPLPETVLLAGRFALRLGYQGRPHPYQVMDADPSSSAPFFEQMFPFESASESYGPEAVPLSAYAWPDQLAGLGAADGADQADRVRAAAVPLLASDGLAPYIERVHRAFEEEFDRLLGVSVTSYALEDYTQNQMRVLAALNLMRSPPGLLARQSGRSRDIVAAALGQTDQTADAAARVDRSVFAFQGGFELKYEQLPAEVVDPWLERLLAGNAPDPAMIRERWGPDALDQLRDVLNPGTAPPASMAPEALASWLSANLRTGIELGPFLLELKRLTLQSLVWSLPDRVREEKETWILLDHVHDRISSGLDQTEGERMSPDEVATQAALAWAGTIAAHGRRTRPIAQGLGAVDPTAICTTQDSRAALAEPSIGVLNLDLVVAGRPGLGSAEELLWDRRDDLPWVLVDDPLTSVPALTPLVGLSDGRTLYRVRWKVWSGWHLLWSPELLPTGQRRMAVRTAAICEDMALSAPDLVPTLVRAGMLEGELLPTTPVAPKLARQVARAERKGESAPRPDHSAELAWLVGLSQAPLQKLAGETQGLMVLALELAPTAGRERLPRWRSPTPYLRLQRGFRERTVRASAWARYFPASAAAPVALVPALRPDESVATEHPRPTWRPVFKTDWTAMGGLAWLPLRWTRYTCADQDGTLDSVVPCGEHSDGSLLSEGLGLDLSAGSTVWFQDDPRLAVELGATVRLDVIHSGEPAIYGLIAPQDTPAWLPGGPAYAWSFRPAGGLVVGLRLAPLPGGLWRTGGGWPWGAERADGKSRLARSQMGLRLGMLAGPGYNGLEATALGELWWARSIPLNKGGQASFSPYHPVLIIGPHATAQLGFLPFGPGLDRALVLKSSFGALLGVRAQLRLAAPAPALPEAK